MSVEFTTMRAAEAAEVTAPDGSSVRPLCVLPRAASFAQFELAPGQVSKAVSHGCVQEIWYVVAGGGQMWRGQEGRAEVTALDAGVCLTIPLGTAFQFRAGPDGLRVVAATIPPWPGTPDEARPERGPWLADLVSRSGRGTPVSASPPAPSRPRRTTAASCR